MRCLAFLSVLCVCACGSVKSDAPDGGKGGGGDGGGGGSFSLSVDPGSLMLRRGASADVEVTADRTGGFDGDIVISVDGLPDGVTAEALTIAGAETTGTLTLDAEGGATEGEAALTVSGESGAGGSDLQLLVAGAPGDLDLTFGDQGQLATQLGIDGMIAGRGVTLQDDGKIVGTGSSGAQAITYRLLADGTVDDTFGGGGGVVTTGAGESSGGLVPIVLGDGRVVVAGWGGPLDVGYDSVLYGYTADGVLDSGFGSSGTRKSNLGDGFDEFHGLVHDQDGKLLAAGVLLTSPPSSQVIRYSGTGNKDGTYTAAATSGASVEALMLQSDGKAVLAGYSGNPSDFWLERHLADGSLDTGFDSDGAVTTDLGGSDGAYGVVEVGGGKLVAAGLSDGKIALARYNGNGSLDLTFGSMGKALSDIDFASKSPDALAIDSQGRFIFVGYVGTGMTQKPAVVRFTADGAPDDTFGDNARVILDFGLGGTTTQTGVFGVAIDSYDRIVVTCDVGPAGNQDIGIARIWP